MHGSSVSMASARNKKKIAEVLLYAAPSKSADLRWFSDFPAADPFPAFSAGGRRIGLLPLLEVGRAQKESAFDEVLNLTEIINDLRRTNPRAGVADAITFAALREGIKEFRVPSDFPVGLFLRLKELGLNLISAGSAQDERSAPPLFANRWIKTKKEIEGIKAGNRAACAGFRVIEKILAEAKAEKSGKLLWNKKTLTAEVLHSQVQVAVTAAGGQLDAGMICAPGDQAVDCHSEGTGPILVGQLLVVDIFPRDRASGNYGDMTRTYLKGRATPIQRRMVQSVRKAQQLALKAIRAGVTGADVHKEVADYLASLGYKTEKIGEQYVGFFHGTGHGVGYDLHEEPYLSPRFPKSLQVGQCVTVEPGLYYPGIGGCRIEDCVVVTKSGCQMLSRHPYRWEIA
jgi:Xaa-Pro aminopeptidase